MTEPTLFVDHGTGPLTTVIAQVAFGTRRVDTAVDADDIEADLAVVDSVAKALRLIKETEHTVIVIAYIRYDDQEAAEAFAARHDRVHTTHIVSGNGKVNFVLCLQQIIGEIRAV